MLALALPLMLLLIQTATGQSIRIHGQASGALGTSYDTSFLGRAGLRYIPDATLRYGAFDAEASVNGFAGADVRVDSSDFEALLKPHRLWARFTTARFDVRAGLQKINFGSALLLRPLQWFDRIDPRDPLGLTDGVYAALARYYFQNNANVWGWGLLGNDSTKGWELLPTEPEKPEFGGRVQTPVPRGEVAASYHYRQACFDGIAIPEAARHYFEHRVGLDGKWDLGVGFSLEGVVMSNQATEGEGWVPLLPRWQRMAEAGIDYTFGLGNGIGLVVEHMVLDTTSELLASGPMAAVSAAMASYPLGLVDNLRGIVFFDWSSHKPYTYLSWQRTLDDWVVNLAAFWNPDNPVGLAGGSGAAGKGVQLTVMFNH